MHTVRKVVWKSIAQSGGDGVIYAFGGIRAMCAHRLGCGSPIRSPRKVPDAWSEDRPNTHTAARSFLCGSRICGAPEVPRCFLTPRTARDPGSYIDEAPAEGNARARGALSSHMIVCVFACVCVCVGDMYYYLSMGMCVGAFSGEESCSTHRPVWSASGTSVARVYGCDLHCVGWFCTGFALVETGGAATCCG